MGRFGGWYGHRRDGDVGSTCYWGLIVAVGLVLVLVLGLLPAAFGLAVVFPVLGHATWHLYRKLVPR